MPTVRRQKDYYSYVDEWRRLWEPDLEAIGTNNGNSTDPTRVDPKVLQWVKDHCAHKPHFVKIINPHAAYGRPGLLSKNSCCMGVPGRFVKEHFRELDRVITLEQDDGRKWKVAFGAAQNYPIWCQGWDRFARAKKLKSGDVVVFVLVRNSCFHFKLFDADGNISEKTTSTLNNNSTVVCKKELPSSSSHDQPFVRNSETEQPPKTKKRLFTVSTDHLSTEPLPEYEERDGAAADTLPPHGHLEPVLAKKQTALPTCKERKLQDFGEEFGDGNISEKSTSTLNNDSTVLCKKEFPSSSSQDRPFVSNPETEKPPKTKKRLFTDHLGPEPSPKYEERDGAATNRYGHSERPAKEQTALPERKLRKEFGAPRRNLNLTTEDEIVRVESPHSKTIAIPPYAPKRATESRQLSPALTSPQFESLDPLAFTFKSRRRTVTPLERLRAREMAMAHAGHLAGHYFMTVMSETHVYRDFHLVLPNGFGAALSLPASPTRLKFLNGAGHSWDMYSKKNTMNQFALHRKYWALFALHHRLEEGDVCVFALKEGSTVRTVVVHIFRVVPIAMAAISSVHAHYETHEIDTSAS